jgi:hypothetical protein
VNRWLRSSLVLGFAGLLGPGCGGGRPVEVKAALDRADYATCPAAGGSRITGTSFARQRIGGLVSGAGRPVYLDPATRYSAAVYAAITERQNARSFFTVEKETQTVVPDPVMFTCRRTVQADADGKFAFENVPPGSYIVSSYISWLKPDGEWLGTWNVSSLVVAGDGKNLDVVLSGVPVAIPAPPAPLGR